MPPIINLIPLIIVSGFNLLAIVGIILQNGISKYFNVPFPAMLLFTSLALVLIWLSVFLKRNIWAYLFLFAILASVLFSFDFAASFFYFRLGPIKLDVFAIILLISHFGINSKLIIKERSEKEIHDDKREAIDYFKNQFAGKSNDQLSNSLDDDLVPAAKSAIQELLEERLRKSQ